jgi:hypothetical protein
LWFPARALPQRTTPRVVAPHAGIRRQPEIVTEELDYVPGRFVVNRIVRPCLACIHSDDSGFHCECLLQLVVAPLLIIKTTSASTGVKFVCLNIQYRRFAA